MKIRNKICYLFVVIFLVSCSKDNSDHPLIVPPDFDILPTNDSNEDADKVLGSDDDIEELKDLLLD